MKKTSYLFAAMLMAACASAPVFAQDKADDKAAAEMAKKTVVRAEMAKPLKEIQDFLDAKKFPEALEKINGLNALENRTAYENFALDRMRAIVASGTNDTGLLANSFEGMLATEFLKNSEKQRLIEGLAGTYYNEKKYDLALQWAKRFLDNEPEHANINNLVARAHYLKNDYPAAIKQLNAIIALDDAAKRAPKEENLRLLASSYQHLKDNAGYASLLERMVQHYPTREVWGDLIYRVEHKPGFSDRLRLDLYRLLLVTDNMDDPGQYVEMAELALLAGMPAEAKKAVDAGYAANLLGTGKEANKHKILRDKAAKHAADDLKTLDAGETAAKNAKVGTGLVNIGYNYVINGQAEKGLPLMEQGIAKGGLKSVDEARLHLGMAYLQAGQRAKAEEILKSLTSTDGSADIGRLWLYVKPTTSK